jgi:hypothetical protein
VGSAAVQSGKQLGQAVRNAVKQGQALSRGRPLARNWTFPLVDKRFPSRSGTFVFVIERIRHQQFTEEMILAK